MKKQLSRICMMSALILGMSICAMPAVAQKVSKKAEKYYKKAEEAKAQKDTEAIVKWTLKAANSGHPEALADMGKYHYDGQWVKQDSAKVVEYWTKAAEMGHAVAQCYLGTLYEQGYGVDRDRDKAIAWWTKAAEQGCDLAQYALAWCYNDGVIVDKDPVMAVKWFRRAAEQGDADAQYELGMRYYTGKGVRKNKEEAVKWWKRAAEQGNKKAQEILAELNNTEAELNNTEAELDNTEAKNRLEVVEQEDIPMNNEMVEIPATYPGGETAIISHIAKNLIYPESAINYGIEGVVTFRFKVDTEGNVDMVYLVEKIKYSANLIERIMIDENVDEAEAKRRADEAVEDCHTEAARVVNKLQRFTPAKHKGHPVAVYFTLPIRFQLQ